MRLATYILPEIGFQAMQLKIYPIFRNVAFYTKFLFPSGVAKIFTSVGKKYFYSASKVCPPVFYPIETLALSSR
jgi:hypothetical protein